MNVGALDLAILLVYLAGVVALGTWVGRRASNAADYMLGGRDLPWWLIMVSIVATETSTVTFLSIPGFAYTRDLTWLQIPIGFVIGRYLIAALLLPRYFAGDIFTAYEVLRDRFGGATQRAASALFILTRSLADGLRLFLSSIVLQEMTGLALPWAATAIGVTTIVYTFFGGMRAVVWTDLVQFTVYMLGGGIAFALILNRLPGGWSQMLEVGEAAGRLRVFDLGFDLSNPYGLWAGLIGGIFVSFGSHGVDQLMVQRYLGARNLADARRALGLSGWVVFAQFAFFLLLGVALFAFYQTFAPATEFERADRIFAHFILAELPTGLLGLLLGAVFAAAMSTLSSSLNSCATAAVNDIYLPLAGKSVSSQRQLWITRLLTVLFGLVQIVVGISGQWLQASVVSSILGVAGFTIGIVLGVFFLGIFTERVGQRAAFAGLVTGLAVMSYVFFATPLAWTWFALVGSTITFVVGLAASRVWPRRSV
ncbi:MAG: sodium:solute symporter [Acidobacteriota bacterium]